MFPSCFLHCPGDRPGRWRRGIDWAGLGRAGASDGQGHRRHHAAAGRRLIGLVAALLGGVFARQALQGLGTPADVLEDAVAYARVMMWTMPLLLVFVLFTQLLYGVGDALSPLLALVVSTCIGLLLTPALIRGWFGLPQMGIQSAAWAEGLAGNLAAMLWLVWRLNRKAHVLAPDRCWRRCAWTGRSWPRCCGSALPTGLQMVVFAVRTGDPGAGQRQRFPGRGGVRRGHADRQLRAFPRCRSPITASILGLTVAGASTVTRSCARAC